MSVTSRPTRWAGFMASAALLVACAPPAPGALDFDLRGNAGTIDTTAGVLQPPATRPRADANGLITYPNYQVAVARRGDTVGAVASRIGIGADELARFNGLSPKDSLNQDAVLALPRRVAGGGGGTDIASIAGAAIDRASSGGGTTAVRGGQEPVRHQVARGETAFSIARLYGVSPNSLAEWNGLGPDLTVREGQFLLIPLVLGDGGSGRLATPVSNLNEPVPPSASSALPETIQAQTLPASPQLDQFRTQASAAPAPPPVATPAPTAPVAATAPGSLKRPVSGEVIRGFSAKNEGVDIRAGQGSAVVAAAAGTVAAITRDTEQVPILVLRHAGGLLTVYANIGDIKVSKGDTVTEGQRVASVGGGDPAFLHFEVRRGFDAVDPAPLLR